MLTHPLVSPLGTDHYVDALHTLQSPFPMAQDARSDTTLEWGVHEVSHPTLDGV